MIAIMNLGTAIMRPLIGVISDRIGRITTACAFTLFNAVVTLAFWIPITSYAPLIVFALIVGGTAGIFWVCAV